MTEIMHGLDEQSVEFQADKQTTGAQYVDKDQMVLQFKQAAELLRAEEEWGSEAQTRNQNHEHNLAISRKSEIGTKTELELKFNILEQIQEDPVLTESEWRSELGTNLGRNDLGMRKMTMTEQKAYRLGATGSNSFTMA